jgi:transposase InsO family protein
MIALLVSLCTRTEEVTLPLVIHSDWPLGVGKPCQSWRDMLMLKEHQMIPSMSRPANPYDNASCESS